MSSPAFLEALANELGPVLEAQKSNRYGVSFKHDLASTSPDAYQYAHGPNGALTFPGVDPAVFNATMGSFSIMSQIPTSPSLYTNPTYWVLTGVRDDTGAEADGPCDDAPVAGLAKGCLQTSVFGRYERATPILDIGRLGARTDRADPMDLRLVGSPIGAGGPFQAGNPNSPGTGMAEVLTNEVARKFWERNVAIHRLLARQLWIGNPTNNTGAGGYKEMTGLELLVNTGYHDAETGVACAAADSYVVDFGHARIDLNGTLLVSRITDMYYQIKQRAIRSGVWPVRLVMAMRPQMFYELTAIWPCSYLAYRCQGTVNYNSDTAVQVRMRDEMRAGSYLLIDGDRVDVITDDGIPETSNTDNANVVSGCFASDIYLLPMSIVGGQSTLYMEYFQYSNPSINDALGNMVLGRVEGPWLTWPRQTNMCVQWQSRIEPRLVLRTPWLAARLQNVVYCPAQHERDVFPEDPYFVNGGRSNRPGPSYHQLWAS